MICCSVYFGYSFVKEVLVNGLMLIKGDFLIVFYRFSFFILFRELYNKNYIRINKLELWL